jgi:hypothetical protein
MKYRERMKLKDARWKERQHRALKATQSRDPAVEQSLHQKVLWQFGNVTRAHVPKLDVLHPGSYQSKYREANLGAHLSYLPVFPLTQHDPDPGSGDFLSNPDRWMPLGYIWRYFQQFGCAWLCPIRLSVYVDLDTLGQLLRSLLSDGTVHLHEILSGVPKLWVEQAMVHRGVVGQKQQSLAVVVEPSHGIDVFWHVKKIGKRLLPQV